VEAKAHLRAPSPLLTEPILSVTTPYGVQPMVVLTHWLMVMGVAAAVQPLLSATEAVTVWHTASAFAGYVKVNGAVVTTLVVVPLTNVTAV
jgi:hypothetical protein